MKTYKLDSLNELIDAMNMGLDVEFFIDGTRYNISWRDKIPFICVCPNGEAVFFKSTQDLLDNYMVKDIPIKDMWKKIDVYSM